MSGQYYKYKFWEGDWTIDSINGCLSYNLDELAINNILVWCGLCEYVKWGRKLNTN